jgi:hypothetical protein
LAAFKAYGRYNLHDRIDSDRITIPQGYNETVKAVETIDGISNTRHKKMVKAAVKSRKQSDKMEPTLQGFVGSRQRARKPKDWSHEERRPTEKRRRPRRRCATLPSQQYIASAPSKKRIPLQEARAKVLLHFPKAKKQRADVFLKYETYEQFKVPRPINDTGRQITWKLGRAVKVLEENTRLQRWSLKGLPPPDRAKRVKQIIEQRREARGRKQIAIAFDGAGWDGSLLEGFLDASEWQWLRDNVEDKFVAQTLDEIMAQHSYRTKNKVFEFIIKGTRRSGDPQTKAGNDMDNVQLQDFSCLLAGLDKTSGQYDLFIDGDDCIIIMDAPESQHEAEKFLEKYTAVIASLGIEPEARICRCYIDEPINPTDWTTGLPPMDFCSAWLYKGDAREAPQWISKLPRATQRYAWTTKIADADLIGLARAKALSSLATYPSMPILRDLAIATILEFPRGRIPTSVIEHDEGLAKLGAEGVQQVYRSFIRLQTAAEFEERGHDEKWLEGEQARLKKKANDQGLEFEEWQPEQYKEILPPVSIRLEKCICRELGESIENLRKARTEARSVWKQAHDPNKSKQQRWKKFGNYSKEISTPYLDRFNKCAPGSSILAEDIKLYWKSEPAYCECDR